MIPMITGERAWLVSVTHDAHERTEEQKATRVSQNKIIRCARPIWT